jgi:hypothetical protein
MLDRKGYRYALIGLAVAEALFLIGVSVISAVGHDVPKELWTVGTALGGGLLGVLVPRPQPTSGSKPFAESLTVHNAAVAAASKAAEAGASAKGKGGAKAAPTSQVTLNALATALSGVSDEGNLKRAIAAAGPSPGAGAAGAALAREHTNTAQSKKAAAKAQGVSAASKEALTAEASVYSAAGAAAVSPETTRAAKAAAESAPAGGVKVGDYLAKLLPPIVVFGLALYLGTHLTDKTVTLSDYRNVVDITKGLAVKPYLEALASHQQAVTSEGNALIALATAAGGAIVGVLAPSPGEASSTASK